MNKDFSWTLMAKVVAVVGFVSVPAILLAAYATYSLRQWLHSSMKIDVPDLLYLVILFLVMWAAMWLTAGNVIRQVRDLSRARDLDK